MTEIKMPSAGQTTDEAKIVAVNVKVGDTVKRGDVLVEAETDKAVLPVESFASGTVLAVLVEEGSPVTKGTVLLVLGKAGETYVPAIKDAPASPNTPAAAVPQTAKNESAPASLLPAMPNAKKEARDRGLSLTDIPAANGLFLKRSDVLAYAEAAASAETPARLPEREEYLPIIKNGGRSPSETRTNTETSLETKSYSVMPMDRMRRIIGQRMLESSQNIPAWQCVVSVDMTNAIALREAYKKRDVKLSFNDILAKAIAVASRKYPLVNARYEDGEIRIYDHTNVGLAVVTDNGNLVVPVVREIDRKSLAEIGSDYKALIKKARVGKLLPDEMGCGSITISNLGMYDVDQFVAIVNPPESCILAVGRIQKQPVWDGTAFSPRDMMTITGSFDHRMIDGAYGAQFLKDLKTLMEEPVLLWVDAEVSHGTV